MSPKEKMERPSQLLEVHLEGFPCRVCHAQTEEIETVHDCRAEHLSMTDAPHRIYTENFVLHRCPQCSHYQIVYHLPKEYYASYASTGMGQQQYSGVLNQVEEKIQRLWRYSPPPAVAL